MYERYAGESEEDYSKRCAIELEKKILKLGPENVSGFVGETMMGGLIGDVEPSKITGNTLEKFVINTMFI